MGIINHERRCAPVIDHHSDPAEQPQSQSSFLEMEDEKSFDHHPWREPRPSPSKRSRPSNEEEREKHVAFSFLEVREYNQVLGDHPCCTVGPPVSLGWDYTESPKVHVEVYEASRAPCRARGAPRLSCEARNEIVSQTASPSDVRRVQRRLSRERCCDNKTIKTFFGASVTE